MTYLLARSVGWHYSLEFHEIRCYWVGCKWYAPVCDQVTFFRLTIGLYSFLSSSPSTDYHQEKLENLDGQDPWSKAQVTYFFPIAYGVDVSCSRFRYSFEIQPVYKLSPRFVSPTGKAVYGIAIVMTHCRCVPGPVYNYSLILTLNYSSLAEFPRR